MRRAALASFAFAAAARSPRADKSVRVITTAIETSMLRWNRITATSRRESPASHGSGPLVLAGASTQGSAQCERTCKERARTAVENLLPGVRGSDIVCGSNASRWQTGRRGFLEQRQKRAKRGHVARLEIKWLAAFESRLRFPILW